MPIYELRQDAITLVPATTFVAHGVRERQHLQRLLREAIEVVAPSTMVLNEEFSEWQDSHRSIDLLAIDDKANLVVVELKRNDGSHMELQALRYAAMVSTLTFAHAVEAHQRYLAQLGRSEEGARQAILDFLGWDGPHEDQFAQDVRIVLVAPDFSKEITTTVMWLNERALDVRCVRIQPYQLDARLLLDVQQIIPLPEAATFQVQHKVKVAEQRASRAHSNGRDFTRYDVLIAGQNYHAQSKRDMFLLVVQAAIARGASRETLPVARGKWLVVEGDAPDRLSFLEKARAEPNRVVSENRWFLKDDQLLRDASTTFALSNQWSGPDVLPAIDQLAARFPELEISYEVSDT